MILRSGNRKKESGTVPQNVDHLSEAHYERNSTFIQQQKSWMKEDFLHENAKIQ